MARERKKVHKVQMTDGKRAIIHQLLDDHLGYSKSQRSESDDYRNGYKSKRVNSSYGDGMKCVIMW